MVSTTQSEEDRTLYSDAELEARIEKNGLWEDKESIAPWQWRKRP